MFLAVHARKKALEKKVPERVEQLMARAITEMRSFLDDPNEETEGEALSLAA